MSARHLISAPLRISLLYALFGVSWIVLGDLFVWREGDVSAQGLLVGLGKGLVFVLVSALLLFTLIRREVACRERTASELRAVLDLAPVGIVAVMADGTITGWNVAAEQILGWSAGEAVGRNIAELGLAPGERAASLEDVVVRSRAGDEVALRFSSSGAGATPDGSRVLVFRDRRPQIQMENALRQAHKFEAVGRLAGGVAHEFNNVLTAIIGHAALLLEQTRPGDGQREHVEEVRRGGERAAALTRQLLVLSGRHVTRPGNVDLARVLHELRSVAGRLAGDAIRLELQLAEPLWPVRCDVAQIQQLVLNLVINARDAMSAGGTLSISTSNYPHAAPRAAENPVPPGDFVLLAVSDTGIGMGTDTLAHLFEPFFTTKEQGTGLGLATVYGIVQQTDGHIRVHSEPDRGASFHIYLPRAATSAAEAATPTPRAAPGASLLVVDDDDAVRHLTCRILRRNGHRVVSARNGAEGLSALSLDPDIRLVIADIVMPGMTGFELGVRIRAEYPAIRILYTSGYVAAAVDSTALDPDMDFLEKPYRPDQLVDRVNAMLASG